MTKPFYRVVSPESISIPLQTILITWHISSLLSVHQNFLKLAKKLLSVFIIANCSSDDLSNIRIVAIELRTENNQVGVQLLKLINQVSAGDDLGIMH